MSNLEYFTIFCLICSLHSTQGELIKKLTVVIPQADPLLQTGNTSQHGISMTIIETFAKKINYNVEYLMINETLADVFNTEKSFRQFSRVHSLFEKQ